MKKSDFGFKFFSITFLLLASLIVFYPLVLTAKLSLELYGLGNYSRVLGRVKIFRNLMNSITVVGLTLIGTSIICSLAAFGFSKLKFRFQRQLFLFVLIGIMIPTSAIIFPLFQIIRLLKLYNMPISQVFPYITSNSIFGLLLLKIHFDGIPNEMMESARIDGANSFQIFLRLMLPNATAGLSVLFVNTFMGAWNELQIAITFVNKRDYMTLAALPVQFLSDLGVQGQVITGELFACLVMIMIPVILFYIFAQKLIVTGMTEGAVKG
jgi:raffinose/stachyose/melibiose transport system permease protein